MRIYYDIYQLARNGDTVNYPAPEGQGFSRKTDDFKSLDEAIPPYDTPVIIRTNWRCYLARLKESAFGDGIEFHVFDSSHRVQLTTVTGWKLAS